MLVSVFVNREGVFRSERASSSVLRGARTDKRRGVDRTLFAGEDAN